MIITRFAPAPTGFLHIGSARTALFNWIYARKMNGKFYLRIEDTDRERSTEESVQTIFNSLKWMGIDWDGDPVMQYSRIDRHKEVATKLLESGNAYWCYCTQEELEKAREEALASGKPPKYDLKWRDSSETPPIGINPVLRLKMPQQGESILNDIVQGTVKIQNSQLDDMILLRSDGNPTYMLSVVVDDYDMKITHVIRGDDHLTNTFRQIQIYKAMEWEIPNFCHIPLIHGPDGAKLSKRHGAVSAEVYRDEGILPEAICNYLLRLGWGHKDLEIITKEDVCEIFDLKDIGKSASRFDMNKLLSINSHYIRKLDTSRVIEYLSQKITLNKSEIERIERGINGILLRSKTLLDIENLVKIYLDSFEVILDNARDPIISSFKSSLLELKEWNEISVETFCKSFCEDYNIKIGVLAKPMRYYLTGRDISPGLFDVMNALGREETLRRF
jgi:glutamyl-tRNA synthetase